MTKPDVHSDRYVQIYVRKIEQKGSSVDGSNAGL